MRDDVKTMVAVGAIVGVVLAGVASVATRDSASAGFALGVTSVIGLLAIVYVGVRCADVSEQRLRQMQRQDVVANVESLIDGEPIDVVYTPHVPAADTGTCVPTDFASALPSIAFPRDGRKLYFTHVTIQGVTLENAR